MSAALMIGHHFSISTFASDPPPLAFKSIDGAGHLYEAARHRQGESGYRRVRHCAGRTATMPQSTPLNRRTPCRSEPRQFAAAPSRLLHLAATEPSPRSPQERQRAERRRSVLRSETADRCRLPASDSRALSGTVNEPSGQRHEIRYRPRPIARRRDPARIARPAARSFLPKRSSRYSRRSTPSARYAATCSAAMVEMQLRAEDVVGVLEAQAGGAENVEPGRFLEEPTTVDTPRTLSAYRTARRSSTRVKSFPASLGLC
jgi:hypothetical protein